MLDIFHCPQHRNILPVNIETGNIFLDWTDGGIVTGADPNFGDWIYRVRVETRGRVPRHLGPILLSKV